MREVRPLTILIAILLFCTLCACSEKDDSEPREDGDGDADTMSEIEDETADAADAADDEAMRTTPDAPEDLSAGATSPHNIRLGWAAYSGADIEMMIERKTDGEDDFVEVARRPAGHGRFLDLALTPDTAYRYRLSACLEDACSDAIETQSVRSMVSVLPQVEIVLPFEGEDTDEVFLVNAQDWLDGEYEYSAMLAVKRDGTILWSMQEIPGGLVTESQPIEEDHSIVAICQTTLTTFDLDGTILHRYDDDFAHHDIDLTSDDKFIYLYWDTFMLAADYPLMIDGIRILDPKTDEITWEWHAMDHVELDDLCEQCIGTQYWNFGHDWTHSNAVFFDEEKQVIYLNVRNLNRIFKIKYPSGEIEWTMGDGGDFGEGLWSHSHDPVYFEEGKILMFDNGLHRPDGSNWSRTIIVDYDETQRHAEISWEYREDPDFFSLGYGSAAFSSQGILSCDAQNQRIFETNMDGEIIWQMEYNKFYIPYKAIILDESFFSDWGAAPTDYGWVETQSR